MPSSKRVRRATLTAQIDDALREDIISGVFTPGQRLAAVQLADRYNVSPTPLREALQRLAADNLVDIDPRLGVTVAPVSLAHLRDTYRVREVLESLALMDSIAHADAEWEKNLRTLFGDFQVAVALSQGDTSGSGSILSWSRAHRAFHDGLLANCESKWLRDLLNILNQHTERYRILSARTGVRDPVGEHASIFADAVRRDAAAATSSLQQHLRRTVEVVERSLDVSDDTVPEPAGRTASRSAPVPL